MSNEFSTSDIQKWMDDPTINPRTGYKIKPNAKNGIVSIIKNKIYTNKVLKENIHITSLFSNDIVHEILTFNMKEKQNAIQNMLQKIWPNPIDFTCSLLEEFDSITDEDESVEVVRNYFKTTINDVCYFVVGNNELNIGSERGLTIDCYQNKANIKTNSTAIRLQYKMMDKMESCIKCDDQYCLKYNISKSFWYNLRPLLTIWLNVSASSSVNMICYFTVLNFDHMIKYISIEELTRDMSQNESHPLLKSYREHLRVCFQGLSKVLNMKLPNEENTCLRKFESLQEIIKDKLQIKEDDYLNNLFKSSTTKKYCDVLEKLDKMLNVQKDIRKWHIQIAPDSIINLKFNKNERLHKKRLQTLITMDKYKDGILS